MFQMLTILSSIQIIFTAFQLMQNIQSMQLNISVDSFVSSKACSQFQSQNQFIQETMQAFSVKVKHHTWFLSTMIDKNKAFRILCFIQKSDKSIVHLNKFYVQANQRSNMNVISTELIKYLSLQSHSLNEIEFAELSMCTANHHETVLHDWIWLDIDVKEVWRKIWCFITSKLITKNNDKQEYLNLILEISWLWIMNVIIVIQNSKIMIKNLSFNENIHKIVESELFFCKNHNLLMYFKLIVTALHVTVKDANDSSFKFNEDFNFDDDVSMIENLKSSFI